MKSTILALALLVVAAGCSSDHDSGSSALANASGTGTDSSTSTQATPTLHIVDLNGVSIPGAQVLIGSKQGTPFAGNFLKADANGDVTAPAAWTDAQDLTVGADGYVRATYVAQLPAAHTIVIRPTLVQQPRTVNGNTTGFGALPNDGTLDVGLVFKTFDLRNLTNFQITDVVSPRMDSVTVAGRTEQIPSNVTLPTQKETYIIPIKFDKPNYSLDLYELGTFNLMAVRAQAPFQKLVKAMMNGQSLMDQINDMHFISAGEEQVTVTADGGALDIPVGTMTFNSSFNWQAPVIDDTSSMMLAVAMASDGTSYYPTDIKRFTSGQSLAMSTLASTPSQTQNAGLVLSVLRSSDENPTGAAAEQVSLTFLPMSAVTAPSFLALIAPPQISGAAANPTITQQVPDAQGLKPLMTTVTGSKIDPTNALLLTPTWDVFANGWIDHVDLPSWPGDVSGASVTPLNTSMRWSVSFGAQDANATATTALGPAAMQNATHLTRSAVDL